MYINFGPHLMGFMAYSNLNNKINYHYPNVMPLTVLFVLDGTFCPFEAVDME